MRPTREDIQKWILWKECNHRCPYTGKHIGFDSLFGPNPSFEIEHIWPRSRCFDDSMANKTLCISSENRRKGNRTPYEYLHADVDRWFHLKKRLEDMRERSDGTGMKHAKIRRFMQKDIPDNFTNRQLTDTSYAAREAGEALSRLWSDKENRERVRVQPVSGRATSLMRRLWGMDGILTVSETKTRDDHRHHAVDALVVACIHPGVSQVLASYWQGVEKYSKTPLNPPWQSIRQDAEAHLYRVVVSHRTQRKVSGALHEESIYGRTDNVSPDGKYTQFVRRKAVDELTAGERQSDPSWEEKGEGIRDPAIREAVARSLESKNSSHLLVGERQNPIRRVRLLKKRDASLMRKATTGYVEVGENHHVAIYRNSKGKVEYEIVSLLEAATRLRKHQPVVKRDRDGFTFVNSLAKGEAIQIDDGIYEGIWIVGQTWANGQVQLARHTVSIKDNRNRWLPTVSSLVSKHHFSKISVDPIGRIRRAND